MSLTRDYKETIAARASIDPAFVKALRAEIADLNEDEKMAASDLLKSVLVQARRISAAEGNSLEIRLDPLRAIRTQVMRISTLQKQ